MNFIVKIIKRLQNYTHYNTHVFQRTSCWFFILTRALMVEFSAVNQPIFACFFSFRFLSEDIIDLNSPAKNYFRYA